MDQRTCIKFCVKNENTCADAFRMLTVAYGEATLDRSNVYRWYKMFSEGREDVNDEERAGRPSTSTTDEKINEVEKMILANRRITVREVAEDLNISIGSCHSIFINDLGMRRVAAKFVPKLFNYDQKQHRMNIANEMLDSVRDDPNLLQRIITGDEAWVYGYDVETKAQSSQWKLPHEPRPKKARQVRSIVKVLLTVFFDCRGVVHHEFLPQGRTVNKEYYLQVMRNLREAIRQKRPDLWKNKNWLLHHDNAPAHTSLLVRDFLAKNNTLMMPQPPYSPDLAPSAGAQMTKTFRDGLLCQTTFVDQQESGMNRMVETRSGKMQDPAQERIMPEESAKPQPGATIGRDASSDPVVLNPSIDIPKFDGTEDPRPWIESLEEIGFLYHWADYIISRYAAMNMIGSAKTWLNLHKISFTSWENFKSRLIQDFASDANKEEMKMRLNRMQQWNEPAIRFAEDILVLCNKVDPQKEEETKINWVIGGLKKEYSFALHLNPPKNTNELLEICKKLDLFEKNYQERAEKSKALYNGPLSPRPHHQEQWKNATSFRRPYQNTSKPQDPAPRYYQNKPLPQVSAPRRSYTPNPEPKPVYPSKTYNKNPNSNRNRTEDGRPICFKCNKPGHVARYCRVRFVRIVEEDPIVTQDKVEEEIRMDNGTQKSRPLLYADVSNSPYSSIPTRNRYAALEDLN
ncbi:hypothetical protein LAZ67_11001236 [Cordylochernes scorpioides]|uniref:CCHC-type domain-containing protein n=1 Tax=Cordylochernes scorpioides TaxID=51811 RepID=A0ABY6L375_9ARAC|nr:hypothetical protein LAZ67_11001236 [Cordylochernes scorpioides]